MMSLDGVPKWRGARWRFVGVWMPLEAPKTMLNNTSTSRAKVVYLKFGQHRSPIPCIHLILGEPHVICATILDGLADVHRNASCTKLRGVDITVQWAFPKSFCSPQKSRLLFVAELPPLRF
jgi:hypothetical protein